MTRRAAWGCVALLGAAALLSACCGGGPTGPAILNDATSLDPPLPPPAADGGDPYPPTCNVQSFQNDKGNYAQADATCWVPAGIGQVWKALQDPTVTEDPHTTSFSVTNVPDSDPSHVLHQMIHYNLTDILQVSYDLEWIHVLDEGTVADPDHVVITFQKVSGTSYVSLWADSFELTSPAAGVTKLVISAHENAMTWSPTDLQKGILQYYSNIGSKLGVPANVPQ